MKYLSSQKRNILLTALLFLISSSAFCAVRYPKIILRNGQTLPGTFVYTSDTVLRMRSLEYGTITKYYAKDLKGVITTEGDTLPVKSGKIQGFSSKALLIPVQQKTLLKKGKKLPQVYTRDGRWIVGEVLSANDTLLVIENCDFKFAIDSVSGTDIDSVFSVRKDKMITRNGRFVDYKEEYLYNAKEYKKFKKKGLRPKRFRKADAPIQSVPQQSRQTQNREIISIEKLAHAIRYLSTRPFYVV